MQRRLRWITLAVSVIFLLTGADTPGRTLDIYFIDAMGGAATLLVTPERESVLIDTGWPGLDDRDPKRIAHVLKDVAGLDHLDHVVTTHWHADPQRHRRPYELVRIDNYRTGYGFARWTARSGWTRQRPIRNRYRKAAKVTNGAPCRNRFPLKGGVNAVVLASGGEVIDAPSAKNVENRLCASAPPDMPVDPSENARSLAIRFQLGKFQFLDCGDLTWNVEKKLVCPTDRIGLIDLYQVTHHGMAISNHPTLVNTIEPIVAVMNNGPRKGGDAKAVALLKSSFHQGGLPAKTPRPAMPEHGSRPDRQP